ncbi:MAG: energy transducer TonB [Proteobacteria bacterium]|nr:MAG: energy transducer TonB [Pseudomonadota bacterium]
MTLTVDTADISPRDRAGFTLFGSALIHIVIIMGVGFAYTLGQEPNRASSSIETILANTRTSEEVEDAEVFAQTSQRGGGHDEEPAPVSSPLPLINDPATRLEAQSPDDTKVTEGIDDTFMYVELPESLRLAIEREQAAEAPPTDATAQEGSEAMLQSPVLARFDPEFSTGIKVPRQKYISSRTKAHKYASYMEAWRAQVEQVGNANYPEQAKSQRLSGSLVLDVAIRADGSIHDIGVIRSSGQKILDDSAIRIVMMAAPFKPFPKEILKEADLLHITRTWQFLHNSALIQN